jgi:predicted dehydrogenase
MRDGVEIVVIGAGSALELYAASLMSLGRAVSICDLDEDRAITAGGQFGMRVITTAVQFFPPGAVVVNLTPPAAQSAINLELLSRGHSVYSEKPGVLNAGDLSRIMDAATGDRRFAIAPDTQLSPAVLQARGIARSGKLGRLRAIEGEYRTIGHESWHPRPWIFYGPGGGVCLDIAPYFLRVIDALCGDVTLVSTSRRSGRRPDLTPDRVTAFDVPLHCTANLVSSSGVDINLDLSFDAKHSGSQLVATFDHYKLILDPVDGGSGLSLIELKTQQHETLEPATQDRRGAGLRALLDHSSQDPYFGPMNRDRLLNELSLLHAMNGR